MIIVISLQGCSLNNKELQQENRQEIKAGNLDVRGEKLADIGPIPLEGKWEFYWQQFLIPKSLDLKTISPDFVNVPDTWSHYELEAETIEKYGYATYRLNILTDEDEVGQSVALYIPGVATAYDLWINGKHRTSVGLVGDTREKMVPKYEPQIIPFELEHSELDVVIHVSNFHQRKSGLWDTITFGTADQIMNQRGNNIFIQAFIIGSIFIIGFYHLMIFVYRNKDLSSLFLALTCFAVTLRTLILKETFFVRLFPFINWEIMVSLEYLSNVIGILFFLLFIKREISNQKFHRLSIVYAIILIIYSLFILITPARMYTNTYVFFQTIILLIMGSLVVVIIYGVKQKKEGAFLQLIAITVLALSVTNDLFYYVNLLSTDELVSVGLLFYLFMQSIHLARKYSQSYHQTEKLSHELHQLNVSLESKVATRTKELKVALRNGQKIENSRRRLLASVSHELNTPLTFIQGYIKAMLDGVVSRDDSSYLRAVYRDTQIMIHMIDDLQELSKLESGQMYFQFKEVNIQPFIQEIFEEQKSIFHEKDLQFIYEEYVQPAHNHTFICSIDPIRIKQVISNLIINAQKFTPDGGMIKLEIELPAQGNGDEIKISVIDTGIGINQEDLPYVFERFYKIRQGDEVKRGAGLGLAICKEIVEYHGGIIGVISPKNRGSSFYFTLPIKGGIESEMESINS